LPAASRLGVASVPPPGRSDGRARRRAYAPPRGPDRLAAMAALPRDLRLAGGDPSRGRQVSSPPMKPSQRGP